ncbi:ElyC/SanA/YdcF family protein, partial [Phaeovulum veldkampii]
MFIRYLLPMLIALALVVALTISQGLDFKERSQATADPNSYPRTAIVFSGQFDRIEVGLQLIEDGAIDRLLVSGANPKSGIHQARFSDQFNLTIRQRSALANGQIILADGALSTLENAIESECWLQSSPEVSEVLLITSTRHMARASLV